MDVAKAWSGGMVIRVVCGDHAQSRVTAWTPPKAGMTMPPDAGDAKF